MILVQIYEESLKIMCNDKIKKATNIFLSIPYSKEDYQYSINNNYTVEMKINELFALLTIAILFVTLTNTK